MKVTCFGRLTADPVLKPVNQTHVCEFSVAENYYRKGKDGENISEPHFFNCVAWDSGANTIAKHFKKGDRILFEAVARQERWTDDGGKNHSRVVFRVTEFKIIDFSNKEEVVNADSE